MTILFSWRRIYCSSGILVAAAGVPGAGAGRSLSIARGATVLASAAGGIAGPRALKDMPVTRPTTRGGAEHGKFL